MSRRNRKELEAALSLAMRETSGLGVLVSQTAAAHLGIGPSELECLDHIVVAGPATAGDLAARTGLTTGAITGVIDRLEKAGFAKREADPDDRRKVLVRALPVVAERIAPLFAPMEREQMKALATYSDRQLEFLIDFFARTREAARAAMAEMQAMATRDAASRRKSERRPSRDLGRSTAGVNRKLKGVRR